MQTFEYPLLPNKTNLINLKLDYQMDNFKPLYCRYIIWLTYKKHTDISYALWSTEFLLQNIVEELPSVQNLTENACNHYGMEFIKRRFVERYNISYQDYIEFKTKQEYDNLKWYKKNPYDTMEYTSYIVNNINKNMHKNMLWAITDELTGYRCFIKNPLTDLEKTILQEL